MEDISKSNNEITKFLIRLYGGKVENLNDASEGKSNETKETLVFYAVGLAGLGPKLYGTFDGGRIEEYVESHMLRELDYKERPDTILELARKLARFHSLDLPIARERQQHVLDVCKLFYQHKGLLELRKLAHNLQFEDISVFENFDVKAEIEWLKKVEKIVNGRIVTISGDLNKNNILIRDEPDKFGERVMIIDYEYAARGYRGRDLGQIFLFKVLELNEDSFHISCEYPDENWRRLLVSEYLKETKKLNYFDWNEKLDNVDHVLMEADFFMFYTIHLMYGVLLHQTNTNFCSKIPVNKARSLMVSKYVDGSNFC